MLGIAVDAWLADLQFTTQALLVFFRKDLNQAVFRLRDHAFTVHLLRRILMRILVFQRA